MMEFSVSNGHHPCSLDPQAQNGAPSRLEHVAYGDNQATQVDEAVEEPKRCQDRAQRLWVQDLSLILLDEPMPNTDKSTPGVMSRVCISSTHLLPHFSYFRQDPLCMIDHYFYFHEV